MTEINANDMILFLSHQVRTSMSGMMGYIEKLYDSQYTTKEKLTTLAKLRSILESTNVLLEDAEHLASYEKGSFSVRSSQFSLEEEMSETIHFLEAFSSKNQLKFRVITEGKVPCVILSDPLRLKQLVTQMVCHAIHLLDRGSLNLTISLSNEQKNELLFTVDSTGKNFQANCLEENISSATQAELFTLPCTTGQQAIAIPLIKALSQSLGGKLSIQKSKLGCGYSLTASINPGPINPSQLHNNLSFKKLEDSTGVKSITIPDFSNKKFLVVEDDEDINALFLHFLKQTGAIVKTARDGEDALKLALSEEFDIMMMDLQIPKINGIEVCTRVRKEGITTPIIALTANTAIATKKKCLKAGFNLFLTKPLSIDVLYQIIPKLAV